MMTKQAKLKQKAYQSSLKSRALSVLIYLIDRSNKDLTCFPAIPTMAEQLHVSISTVKRALQRGGGTERVLQQPGGGRRRVRGNHLRESAGTFQVQVPGASNLSAALALKGYKVMQVGCDPKSDSTKNLMEGKRIPTVLEQLKEKGESLKLEDIVFEGFGGVMCVEAGGPTPGMLPQYSVWQCSVSQ